MPKINDDYTGQFTSVPLTSGEAVKLNFNKIAESETVKGAGKQIENLVSIASVNKQHFYSIIFTIMDALNYSVVGGLQGLKVELKNIIKNEKENAGGESNVGLEFIGECIKFITFFSEYIRINKNLKSKISVSTATTVAEAAPVTMAATMPEAVAVPMSALASEESNTNEDQIQSLNNAFKHLAFTYGQLTGRTIYYLSKLLRSGAVAEPGFFDPISFGSITTTLIKASPAGGVLSSVVDSVSNFFTALADAGKSSFKSLEIERKLANDYMQFISDKSGKLSGGGNGIIDDDTFQKLHNPDPKSKKKNKDTGNYSLRFNQLLQDKKTDDTIHPPFTKKDIQRKINEIETVIGHYNHVNSLVTLFKQLNEGKNKNSIYIKVIKDTSSNDVLERLIIDETKALKNNEIVKKKFNEMLNDYSDFKTYNVDFKTNIELFNIVKNFIIKNKDLIGTNIYKKLQKNIPPNEGESESDTDAEAVSEGDAEAVSEGDAEVNKVANKLLEIVISKNEMNSKGNNSKQPDIVNYLETEHKKLETMLSYLNKKQNNVITSNNSSSKDYNNYSQHLKDIKSDMKRKITSLKTMHSVNDKNMGSAKTQKSTDLINSGLKKILTFISIQKFGAINNMVKNNNNDINRKKGGGFNSGGGKRRSSIRRRINIATRRIQTSLDSFNSTTRRNVRAKPKPRETRRQHYGH